MTGKVRHLVNRSGRYHARLVVPKNLRGIVSKTELRLALGADYREALKKLPSAVTQLQHEMSLAERKASPTATQVRYPLGPEELAHSHYMGRLAFDEECRIDPRYAMIGIDDLLVLQLKDAIAGRATDDQFETLVGFEIQKFRKAGNISAKKGSDEWRIIARALCSAELEALARASERDEGDFSGVPTAPILANAKKIEETPQPVSIKRLWTDYVISRKQAGFMRDGGRRQISIIDNLLKFLKHDDASRITKKDMMDWRDHLMQRLAANTVSDVYLSTVRTLFNWAVDNDRLKENPAEKVKQPKPKKIFTRERGYTDAKAVKVLRASRTYEPNEDINGYIREKPELVEAKRWVPIICAFTGARVSEITQLRGRDIREEGGRWVLRITPDAGTVKSGGYRDVPLHPQIIAEGFIEFLKQTGQGPLFHNGTVPEKYAQKSKQISNQLATWLTTNGLKPDGLAPNHAWRHRLKTQCIELGISDRVMDAIQGHAGRTAGDNYGDVTLKAKRDALEKLASYCLI